MHPVHDLAHHLIAEHRARVGDAIRQAPHLAELHLSRRMGRRRPTLRRLALAQGGRLRQPPPTVRATRHAGMPPGRAIAR